ncbi:MAG: T9SS type A sorting domain-containing protein [Chitinophagaceae bacterium]|nr:T9SS type A sorting domain-containing protein [Chitinophagaceae bacterium]
MGNGYHAFEIYLEKGKKAVIIVTDLQGRTIHRQSVTGQGLHREKINLDNKASGILFLQLQKDNAVEIKKISVVR